MANAEKGEEKHVLDEHGVEHLTEAELTRRDQERIRHIAQEKQKALDSLRQQQNDEIEKAGVPIDLSLRSPGSSCPPP